MESSSRRNNTRAMTVFWSLLVVCGLLTAVCVHLAGREVGQPWAGFSFNAFGDVMKANNTGLVFFDSIVAVAGQPVQQQKDTGAVILLARWPAVALAPSVLALPPGSLSR
jgi:hypothetical protein